MKYKIPFDEKLFIEQSRLTLPYVYINEYRKVRESIVIFIICFILGLAIIIGGSELGFLFFSIGIFSVYDFYWKNENYKNIKNNHIKFLREYHVDYGINSFGVFEFRHDCLRFTTDFLCSWVNWEDFKTYKVIKSNLILIQKEHYQDVFVIGESEVNEVEFKKILDFIKVKIN